MIDEYTEQEMAAAREWLDRKSRRTHPHTGRTGKGGQWYPSDTEQQQCCKYIRRPSRAWPWSLMTHCRTAKHVARLYGVDEPRLKQLAREMSLE